MLNIDWVDNGYYIENYEIFRNSDKDIAQLINLEISEYREILKKFNAHTADGECYFWNKSDAQQCCDYLNEVYVVIIKLLKGR